MCVSNERPHNAPSAFLFPTRSSTNQSVRPQNIARGLKPLIQKIERLYYLCSKTKDADQLCGYHAADLRPCAFVFAYTKNRFYDEVAKVNENLSIYFLFFCLSPKTFKTLLHVIGNMCSVLVL